MLAHIVQMKSRFGPNEEKRAVGEWNGHISTENAQFKSNVKATEMLNERPESQAG
jgi:hypothetical protein